jgi:hypothetical protein
MRRRLRSKPRLLCPTFSDSNGPRSFRQCRQSTQGQPHPLVPESQSRDNARSNVEAGQQRNHRFLFLEKSHDPNRHGISPERPNQDIRFGPWCISNCHERQRCEEEARQQKNQPQIEQACCDFWRHETTRYPILFRSVQYTNALSALSVIANSSLQLTYSEYTSADSSRSCAHSGQSVIIASREV